jgi:hypothetical protein
MKNIKDEILKRIDFDNYYRSRLKNYQANGTGKATALCPFHDDTKPSLSITINNGHFHCYGACGKTGDIFKFHSELMGIDFKSTIEELSKEVGINKDVKKELVTTYDYIDESRHLLFQVCKYTPKSFNQRRPDGKGKWIYNIKGVRLIPYNLPEIIKEKNKEIFIVEGEKDVETLRKIGLIASCNPMGAGKWIKEYNKYLKDKEIVLLPDNDQPDPKRNGLRAGYEHMLHIARELKNIAASIKIVELPELPNKGDVSDWLKTHSKEDLIKIVEQTPSWKDKEGQGVKSSLHSYFIDDEGYSCRLKATGAGPIPVRLANFSACIDQEIIEDDGIEQKRIYQVSGKTGKEKTLPNLEVNASSFGSMNWAHHWGTQAILEPGESVKDYLRHFIQVSSHPKITTSYSHTGWREINGEWVYLSSSGAIGKPHVTTKLPRELQRYSLPLVPEKEKEAIEASLEFLTLSKPSVTFPLFAMIYMSVLTTVIDPQPNFSGFVYGETGSKKTTIAVLMLSHFGNFTSIQQMTNFESTANSIMRRASVLKDTLLIVDDYHPTIQEKEAQRKESILQRIIRSASNRTDRGRLNPDSTEKGSYEPRGMILITGEDLPTLQSTLARILVVEILKEDISLNKLTELQRKAHLLPYAMSSYIHFLRNNFLKIQSLFSETFTKLREKALSENLHGKLSEQIAFLYFTLEVVTAWAFEKGIMNNQRSREIKAQGWQAFTGLANFQQRRFERENPVRTFIEVLDTLINQGKVYLEHKENYLEVPILGHMKGDFIGCFDDDYFYIMPPALWNAVQRFCRMEGTHFPVTKNTLYRLLKISGLIETKGESNTVAGWIKGKTTKVLKFYRTNMDNFKGKGGKE